MKKTSKSKLKGGQKRMVTAPPKLKDLTQIRTVVNLSEEQMHEALKHPFMRIHGILYDMPTFQLNRYIKDKQFGSVELTLNKAKSQKLPEPPKENIN